MNGGMTLGQLSERIRTPRSDLALILLDEVERGNVVEHDERYVLAPEFAQQFAAPLRGFDLPGRER